jgi:hypothetical protein
MLSIFKKNNSTIHSISLPDWGWKKEKAKKSVVLWINPEQTIALSLSLFNKKPVFPSIKDVEVIRKFYRDYIAQVDGGIIEVNLIGLKGLSAIRTIFKIPQEPSGVTYIGSLTIPFKKSSYVVKIEAPEIGTTGIRESVIGEKLLKENTIHIVDNGFEDWAFDPYDKNFKDGLLMNKSEYAQYDKDFPDHPLSKARILLDKLESEIKFNQEIWKNKKFEK